MISNEFKELGNPNLLVKGILKMYEIGDFPLHFLAGSEAYNLAIENNKAALADFEKYKDYSVNMDFGKEEYWQ